MDSSNRTIVTRCLPNTPAFRRDIPSGVYVVSVNDEYVVGKHFKEVQKLCKDAERPMKIDFSTIPPAKKGERPPKPAAEAVHELGIVAEAVEPAEREHESAQAPKPVQAQEASLAPGPASKEQKDAPAPE